MQCARRRLFSIRVCNLITPQKIFTQKKCLQTISGEPAASNLTNSIPIPQSPVFDKYDQNVPYWVRLILMRELNIIEAKRKTRELSKEPLVAEEGSKYVCKVCNKPNTLSVTACTACGFPLSKWDLSQPQIVEDLFGKIVRGELDTHRIYYQDSEVVVFGDGFPISDCHLLSIPVSPLFYDITSLSLSHLPLLQKMYKSAVEVIRKMEIPYMKDKKVEEWVIAGFNVPVSVPHLHLHVVLPPLYHLNAFRHPRFHFYQKVIQDIKTHGKIVTYHESPNINEGEKFYEKYVKQNHHTLLQEIREMYK